MGMAGRRRRGRGEAGEEGRRVGTVHGMDNVGCRIRPKAWPTARLGEDWVLGAWGAAQLDGAGDRGGGRMWPGAEAVVLAMAQVHRDGRDSERRRGGGGRGGRAREMAAR